MPYRIAMELNPISAVTAEHPHAYYERLAREKPFGYDDDLRCWVAAGNESVEAALTHAALRARPKAEPVPVAMRGTAVGTLFSRMVRMNDGTAHTAMRTIVNALIDSVDAAVIDPAALHVAATADALMFAYPSRAIAAMLGIDASVVPGIEQYARALARAIGPSATPEHIRDADAVVTVLDTAFSARFPDALTRANAIAFLFQGYDGLAGAIGHALYPHSDRRELAIHNTRRFVVKKAEILGTEIESESTVLVVLATAPRFTFGTGPHACAAAQIAPRIVNAAIAFARARINLDKLVRNGFLPLQNVRVPVLEYRA